MARSRSFPKKLLLSIVALLLALLGAEGVVRLVGLPDSPRPVLYTDVGLEVPLGEAIAYLPRMRQQDFSVDNGIERPPYGLLLANLKLRWGYRPMPRWDYYDENGCVRIDTNSLGLRDEEFAVAKQPGELRILALGDSMTYGLGVRLDLSWPQVLERQLRAERGGPVEVINAGFATGGSDPSAYHGWVKDNGIHFAPDLVVVGLCLNDVDDVAIGMLTYPVVPVKPVLGGWSLLLDRVVQFVRQRQARATPRDLSRGITDESPFWRATRDGLKSLRDTLNTAGIPLVVIVFPMLSQLEPELYPLHGVHRLVTEFCDREGIRSFDLLPAFFAYDGAEEDLWAHASDQHANHVGHEIQAREIHAYLRREGLLPSK